MVTTDVINQKLDLLTRQIEALQQENAALRRDLGILEESIEALASHGIDMDGQIVDICARLRDLEKNRGSRQKMPLLSLIQGRSLNPCNAP